MFRKFFSKISSSLEDSAVAPRRNAVVPVRVWLEPRRTSGALESSARVYSTLGQTSNLSLTGVAFTVPSIRIHENYLVGDDRTLNMEIDLPGGRVRMKCKGRRYEQIEQSNGCVKYLVGVQILSMSRDQRSIYDSFVGGSSGTRPEAPMSLELEKR